MPPDTTPAPSSLEGNALPSGGQGNDRKNEAIHRGLRGNIRCLHYHNSPADNSDMTENTRGGRREGAGRPKVERKRKGRLVYFHDEEWEMVKEKAAQRGMSTREYLNFLAENDRIPD